MQRLSQEQTLLRCRLIETRLGTVGISDLNFQLAGINELGASAYSIVNLQIKLRLICGWVRRARRLDDSLTRAILLSFVAAIGPSRRVAASAGARKPLSSYPWFGRVNGIARPFKGRKSNYVISWLRCAEETAVWSLMTEFQTESGMDEYQIVRRVKQAENREIRIKSEN